MVDLTARILAKEVSSRVETLSSTDVSGLGTAAIKYTGTSPAQIPLLDAQGHLLIVVIPPSVFGGKLYKGLWDATTGIFPVATLSGDMWIVSVTGTIGLVTYNKNDQIVWNGATFDRIDNSELITFAQDIKGVVL